MAARRKASAATTEMKESTMSETKDRKERRDRATIATAQAEQAVSRLERAGKRLAKAEREVTLAKLASVDAERLVRFALDSPYLTEDQRAAYAERVESVGQDETEDATEDEGVTEDEAIPTETEDREPAYA
jgi:hypothetical protein